MKGTVILADDEKEITDSYALFMKRSGITDYAVFNDARELVSSLDSIEPSVIFLDLQMPYYTGDEILEIAKQKQPAASVLIITGNNDVESAVRCMQKGALDYLVKPLDKDRFKAAYEHAMEAYSLKMEIGALRNAMKAPCVSDDNIFCGILTKNSRMREIFRYVDSVSKSSFPVLITGETGTGKELFARAVHERSGRKGDFVAVNVSGLDDTMFSDTLFGHIRGAFTGADKPRKGLIASAEGGTLFLDEIGDLNENAQMKLLRLLQEKVYMPLGSDRNIHTDVRIVTATNVNLNEKVNNGLFRHDLLYRLTTHSIHIPPLRERPCDIDLLATLFYRQALEDVEAIDEAPLNPLLFNILRKFRFPGNVRQLQSIISDMAVVTMGKSMNDRELIKFLNSHDIKASLDDRHNISAEYTFIGSFPTLKEIEKDLVESALRKADGNVSTAARILGITRQALHKRLKPAKTS